MTASKKPLPAPAKPVPPAARVGMRQMSQLMNRKVIAPAKAKGK